MKQLGPRALLSHECILDIEFPMYHKDIDLEDPIHNEYTIGDKFGEIGFIIPSKIKDGESTPMRDIKEALTDKIEEVLS